MFLVAPHKNIVYNIKGPMNSTLNNTVILTYLRDSDIFRNTYGIPPAEKCADDKSFDLKNSNINFTFDGT